MEEKVIIPENKAENEPSQARLGTELVIDALLTYPTLSDAALLLGVSTVTLWRWMKRPAFQAKYREARRDIVSHAIAKVQRATSKAVRTLEALMSDSNAPAPTRLAAAKVVLHLALKGVEVEDMEARLAEIEAAQSKLRDERRARCD